jgi:hypothetical protein
MKLRISDCQIQVCEVEQERKGRGIKLCDVIQIACKMKHQKSSHRNSTCQIWAPNLRTLRLQVKMTTKKLLKSVNSVNQELIQTNLFGYAVCAKYINYVTRATVNKRLIIQ